MTCPSCSRPVAYDAERCPGCGENLDSSASPTLTGFGEKSAPRIITHTPDIPAAAGSGFAPGTTLAGRYRVVYLLGKGGMGEVYRADDLTLNQSVALKFLPRSLAADPEALARFRGEVRVARNVAHSNVCRVFDIGEADGRIFLTMEYIDGEDLASLLRRIGRLPADKALELARQICAGVAAAHDAGVLHRDLKPANIMVDGRGRAHITDFGVAGLAEDLKQDASRAGTPAYMAPEQLAGRGVSIQSDLFSLGLILYEMFTGKRAFEAATINDLLRVHEDSAPSRPSSLISDMDPLVERTILRCLERDPALRPRAALDVARGLPGGDPLAAALAAGETPSPEMVAAAGGEGALEARKACILLGTAIAALASILALTPLGTDLGLAPIAKTPETLTDRAQELAAKLGYKEVPQDTAIWFQRNYAFLFYRAKNLPKSQRLGDIKTAEQGHERFFYRQSPRGLFPMNFPMTVNYSTPAMDVTGMVTMVLHADGKLDEFLAVPPQSAQVPANAPPVNAASVNPQTVDWNGLFAESGLDPSRFQPEPPVWNAAVPFDSSMGWVGSYPQSPADPVHAVAAAFHGRVVYFKVIAKWAYPERDSEDRGSAGQKLRNLFSLGSILLLVALGVVLARRNWLLGRGDFKGAARLGTFILLIRLASWLFRVHHQSSASDEWSLFVLGTAFALWAAALSMIAYIAIEPYVRRRWPQVMTSWTRLLAGRWRDPLVGTDLLAGLSVACVAALVLSIATALMVTLNLRGETAQSFDDNSMRSLSAAVATICSSISAATIYSLGITFMLFLLRLRITRQWVAEAIAIAIATPFVVGSENLWLDLPVAALLAASVVLTCTRLGLLSLWAYYVAFDIVMSFPWSLDPSRWYFNRTLLGLTALLGLAIYAFRTALGGKPAWKMNWEQL